MDKHRRLNPPATQYKPGEEILLRFKSRRRKSPPKRRYVLKGEAIARNMRTSMYKISFTPPNLHEKVQQGISVEDITSVSRRENEERQKKNRKKKDSNTCIKQIASFL